MVPIEDALDAANKNYSKNDAHTEPLIRDLRGSTARLVSPVLLDRRERNERERDAMRFTLVCPKESGLSTPATHPRSPFPRL